MWGLAVWFLLGLAPAHCIVFARTCAGVVCIRSFQLKQPAPFDATALGTTPPPRYGTPCLFPLSFNVPCGCTVATNHSLPLCLKLPSAARSVTKKFCPQRVNVSIVESGWKTHPQPQQVSVIRKRLSEMPSMKSMKSRKSSGAAVWRSFRRASNEAWGAIVL